MADVELVRWAKALREECRRGVEERGVMPNYVDACVTLKDLAPKLLAHIEKLEALLRRIEPHLDAIICYASTMGEHEPNRIVHDVRATLSDNRGVTK